MTKRPTTGGGSARSVTRRLVGYLGDRSIGFKLGLIMLVPTLATVVVGFGALAANIGTAHNADRARILAGVTGDTGRLVHNLQNERAAVTIMLASNDSGEKKNATAEFQSLVTASDDAAHDYTAHRAALTGLPANFGALFATIDDGLNSVGTLRQQISRGDSAQVPPSSAIDRYTNLISSLLAIRDSAAQLAGDSALSYEMRAGAAVSQYKEYVSQERIKVLRILDARELTAQSLDEFIGTLKGQEQALAAFKVVATPGQLNLQEQRISGPDVREAGIYATEIRKIPDKLALSFTADQWDKAMIGWSNQVREVEKAIDDQTALDAKKLRDSAQAQVYLDSGLLAALVLFAVLIAWLVARSMARSLRELRHGALGVAQFGLPQAVARLRDPTLSTQLSPHEVARQIAEPLPVRSRDEFGQVTEAFNAVHLEAVRTAVEQAALRSSVSTMFVNLARRSQILVDRLIGHLDRLERGEEDPDRLAELFQLDHLATRMRRNDENLLVLAGADSTRVQREPAALIDVLRAAQSEVEHYTRIEFGVIDRDIEVASHAVNDLVHLVAELFDNATAFSPPDSTVIVEARRVGDRAVLYVEDHGIGISPDQIAELNERLATPPMVDVAVSRMMGLVVVARLAARHGVKVELRPAPERGTVADVLLPTSVLVPRALAGRGAPAGTPLVREMPTAARPVPPNQPRAPFTSPLALESGPTAGSGRTPAGAGAGPSMGGFGGGPGGYAGPPAVPAGFAGGPPAGFNGDAGNGRGHARPGSPHLPPWSDLTGAASSPNGADLFTPRRTAPGFVQPGDALPQRRAVERPVEGELTDDERRIPRQVPASPEARPVQQDGTGVIDAVEADVVEDRPAAPPVPAPPPPAWPPVPPAQAAESGTAEAPAPPVPEELAKALDITSEIPRIRPDQEEPPSTGWNIGAGGQQHVGTPPPAPAPLPQQPAEQRLAAPQPARVKAYADQTMELPIFQELESAWFRTRPRNPENAVTQQPPGPAAPAPAAPPPAAPPVAPQPMAQQPMAQQPLVPPPFVPPPVPPPLVPPPAPPPPAVPVAYSPNGAGTLPTRTPQPEQSWESAADDGWLAASQAADPQVDGTTSAGLPRRVPMAQLVPGGVEKVATTANRRSPEQVRGLLSAYHRGVQRGRTRTGDDAKNPESTTPGNPPHGGKEQEA